MVPAKTANMGQVIEYLPDRLYLGSYLSPPDADTLFPFGARAAKSPSKRSQRAAAAAAAAAGTAAPSSGASPRSSPEPYYFTVDDSLLYNAFHHDFGPLHVGHLYRFALHFHDILAATESQQRPVVFWSGADPRRRANAACLLACYMVLIQSWPPHLALAPIAQVDPPLMPFRDAGYSQADYGITVQDVVYGVWKAKEEGCCVLDNFNLAEYELFERVENGDFNWVTPHFLAFASPQHSPVARIPEGSELYASLPRTLDAVDAHPTLPGPFKDVLCHFAERNIGLVVRLNSPLYSPSYFEALGIQHLDMIFDDGTCPPLSTVRKFVRRAHEMITVRKKNIAVHCKAGLGRTGCLIGAYLIYRYGFTANEIISFMRFMRPGMVVGPQQHWLHLNQGVFREWWVEERLERKLRREFAAAAAAQVSASAASNALPSTPIRAMQKASLGRSQSTSTPPNRSASGRTPLSEVDQDRTNAAQEDYLPAPTPGQPRKSARADRHHPYSRSKTGSSYAATTTSTVEEEGSGVVIEEEAELFAVLQETTNGEGDGARSSRGSQGSQGSQGIESEEEIYLRMRMHRKTTAAASSSPSGSSRQQQSRTASQSHSTSAAASTRTTMTTTSTTATATSILDNDASFDAENIGSSISRVKSIQQEPEGLGAREYRSTSASGVLAKVRSSDRSGASAKRMPGAQPAGIRKTSSRVASGGSMATASAMASAARKISNM